MRIRIKPAYSDAMAGRFADAGFTPLYIEVREDGDFSFWFDKASKSSPAFVELVQTIPWDWWAIHAIVGSPVSH